MGSFAPCAWGCGSALEKNFVNRIFPLDFSFFPLCFIYLVCKDLPNFLPNPNGLMWMRGSEKPLIFATIRSHSGGRRTVEPDYLVWITAPPLTGCVILVAWLDLSLHLRFLICKMETIIVSNSWYCWENWIDMKFLGQCLAHSRLWKSQLSPSSSSSWKVQPQVGPSSGSAVLCRITIQLRKAYEKWKGEEK